MARGHFVIYTCRLTAGCNFLLRCIYHRFSGLCVHDAFKTVGYGLRRLGASMHYAMRLLLAVTSGFLASPGNSSMSSLIALSTDATAYSGTNDGLEPVYMH